jgi:transposase
MRGLAIRDDMSAAELRQYARTSPDRRAGMRALAIAHAMDGKSRAEAAGVIGRERQSLRDAVVRYNAEGLEGLRDRPGGGAKPQLSAERCAELKAWVTAGPDPERDGVSTYRLVDIADWVERKWGRKYTLSGMSKLLRRIGLSWQKARPMHPQGDAAAREEFKKSSRPS